MPTVTTNLTGTVALDYAGNGLTWIVPINRVVWGSSVGVNSAYDNNTLINRGQVISNDRAVQFGGDAVVQNKASGDISGGNYGVFFTASATQSKLVNDGRITGLGQDGVTFSAGTHGVSLVNNNHIEGLRTGVFVLSDFSGGTIVNSGSIEAYFAGDGGIRIFTAFGLTTTIVNKPGGVIKGPANSVIYADQGAMHVTNSGKIAGGINSDALNAGDVVINRGFLVQASLGSGNDNFNGLGGSAVTVLGEAGTDRLATSNRKDFLDGGADRDVLSGRLGRDTFHFALYTDTASGGLRDVITDFRHAQHDKIDLSDMLGGFFLFQGTGPFAGGSSASIRYAKQNPAGTANDKTVISGDIDGNGTTDFQIGLRGLHNLVAGDFML